MTASERPQVRTGYPIYFSAADRQMELFVNQDAFERSLLCNILFEP